MSSILLTLLLVLASPAAAQRELEIVAFGDSITFGYGAEFVDCEASPGGYPPRLWARLRQAGKQTRMVTSAVCGELTMEGATRIEDTLRQNDADIVLIMEGTNDLSNRGISTESMRFNIRTIAKKVEDEAARPVLITPIPRDPDNSQVGNDRTAFFGTRLRDEAEDQGWGWINAFDPLLDIRDVYERFYFDPLHPNDQGYAILADVLLPGTIDAVEYVLDPPPCAPADEVLCLGVGSRFQVKVEWTDFEGEVGDGMAVQQSTDTGFFWFFGPDNLELMVKILDGRVINDKFWVFYGALSNVGYEITIVDTETGARKRYTNPVGELASVGDTFAFDDQ